MRWALVFLPLSGCATHLSLTAAPTVDGTGHLGTEGRLEGAAAVGTPTMRFYTSLAAGYGYLGALHSGYLTSAVEAGVEGGTEWSWSAGGFGGPRYVAAPGFTAFGGGIAGQLLYRVASTHTEHGAYRVGARLSLEGLYGDGVERALDRPGVVVVQLGFVLRWTTFDTTGAHF